ncbi:MAG: gluconolactonase [Bacteroidetes bacterium GWE2_41_25]|nr:MAG: gluconolactonase [Bacteroidetes bacterium GWA2_40_15]OFX87885.1 MAG: gluconolactonase [Bacteroidetes bacterium GWC2_40_22]OFY05455.1 MAG: gluconolactonase [Bacteroidetes bacterium GWE2_41_25]OFY57904.1 MAG: gluconolactonase [Bacteroidetes bacterium GWF2_41_9]HAM10773.1 gluconolactonase [Bacteroidales bacterium]
MKSRNLFLSLLLFLVLCSFVKDDGLNSIIQDGAQLEKLADGFLFTEGPSADSEGSVFFTDQPNDRIMVWRSSGVLETFLQPSGRSNGLSFDNSGNLWACADEKNELWMVGKDKKISTFPFRYKEQLLNGPNDLWITSDGGIYFTDPFYKRPWWEHTSMPQEIQGVFFISPDKKMVTRIIDDLKQPNGIVGTPDGKTLFVADIGANKTWKYTIKKDGTVVNKELFCELGSDGMTIDSKGNIYLTGKGVTVFDKTGKQIGNIQVPENWTANVCFGDKDLKSLFITASKGLYRIKLKVKGTRG